MAIPNYYAAEQMVRQRQRELSEEAEARRMVKAATTGETGNGWSVPKRVLALLYGLSHGLRKQTHGVQLQPSSFFSAGESIDANHG